MAAHFSIINLIFNLVQSILGLYLPSPEEYKLKDVADVKMVEKMQADGQLAYLSAIEITGGSRITMTTYHSASPEEQAAERKVLETIKSFLHLVKVDYS